MKKAILIISLVILIAGASCQDAKADWLSCTVVSFGQWADYTVFNLSEANGAFSNRWYMAYRDTARGIDKSREMLATAMYAQANGKKIVIFVPTSEQWNMIYIMTLAN